ncbi:Phox-like protein [Xylariaceae sp. FL0594]|nr:Phox-like protein [Xylariaceae sp. FL0594]
MALATSFSQQFPNQRAKGRSDSDSDRGSANINGSKDVGAASMTPRPLPSPPATESESGSEGEPDSYPFPPFVDISEQEQQWEGEATAEHHRNESVTTERRGAPALTLDINNAQQESAETSRKQMPVSPPYWTRRSQEQQQNAHTHTHTTHTRASSGGGRITLRDNESAVEEDGDDRGRACWARSVQVTDHVLVNGGRTSIGAFVVWNIRVETLNGSYMNIRKRYSEFDDFRWRLTRTFPAHEAAVPELPPKSVIAKFRPSFLEKRRAGLQYFLNCIILNPEFSGSPVLKEFLFS